MKTIATTKIEEVENANNPRLWRSIENGASGALAKTAARINSSCSQFKEYGKEHAIMKKHILLTLVIALGLLSVLLPVRQAAHAQGNTPKDFVPPVVFQAAGPTADSIQGTVDAFRAALGIPTTAITQGRSRSQAVTVRSTGMAATPTLWNYYSPGNAVQRLPEHPRRPVHHTGDWPFSGSPIGWSLGRP